MNQYSCVTCGESTTTSPRYRGKRPKCLSCRQKGRKERSESPIQNQHLIKAGGKSSPSSGADIAHIAHFMLDWLLEDDASYEKCSDNELYKKLQETVETLDSKVEEVFNFNKKDPWRSPSFSHKRMETREAEPLYSELEILLKTFREVKDEVTRRKDISCVCKGGEYVPRYVRCEGEEKCCGHCDCPEGGCQDPVVCRLWLDGEDGWDLCDDCTGYGGCRY